MRGSTFVVRPGLGFSQQPEFRSIPIEPAQLEKELANPRLTYDELAAKYWRPGVW